MAFNIRYDLKKKKLHMKCNILIIGDTYKLHRVGNHFPFLSDFFQKPIKQVV